MKITFVLPGYPRKPVGGCRVVYEYANHLSTRGHEMTVAHATKLPTNLIGSRGPIYLGVKNRIKDIVYPIIQPRPHWQAICRGVKLTYIPELSSGFVPDSDVVFATAWQTAEAVAGYPASKGTKCYLVMDFFPWMGPQDVIEATWRLPLFKVAISEWLRKMVCDCGAPSEEAVAIPVGVDHARFALSIPLRARRKRLCMMWGKGEYKTPEIGLRAILIAKERHPDLKAILFGPGSFSNRIPSWIQFRRILSEPDLVQAYNESQVFICSSSAEGFALPPAEAMACGCAVASTDCGGVREFAEHGVTALLSPVGDAETLAANIMRLLDDERLREGIAMAGHERIQRFNWHRSCDLLEKTLQDFAKVPFGQ
jgi:glycosyltransferase involved in cell wall biosynthesis